MFINRLEGIKLECLQDSWVIMYTFIGRELTESGGIEGEAALREASRRIGRDRGANKKKKMLDNNIKINMKTLFKDAADRPSEPRYTMNTNLLTPQETILETLVCSFADVWKQYDAKAIGRIYCEEFHSAHYGEFGLNRTQVNLARTLTQDGDDRCWFDLILRPENMTEEERKLCFEEFDEGYVRPDIQFSAPEGKSGFNAIWIKSYFYMLEAAIEQFGDKGAEMIARGLENAAIEQAKVFKDRAASIETTVTDEFIDGHLPLNIDIDAEPLWETYDKYGAKELLRNSFYKVLWRELS